MSRKSIAILGVILITILMVNTAIAAEGQKTNKFVSFFRGLVRWPARTTQKAVEVTADTAKSAGTVITQEAETVGRVATGQLEETPDLIVEPLQGTSETVVEAVEGTVTAPVDAAKEVSAEQRATE